MPPVPVNQLSICRQSQSTLISRQSQSIICLPAASPSQPSAYQPPVPVNLLSAASPSQPSVYVPPVPVNLLCAASPSLHLRPCRALLLLPSPRSVPSMSTTPCGSGLSAFPSRCRPSPASPGQLVSPLPAPPARPGAHGSLRTSPLKPPLMFQPLLSTAIAHEPVSVAVRQFTYAVLSFLWHTR